MEMHKKARNCMYARRSENVKRLYCEHRVEIKRTNKQTNIIYAFIRKCQKS